MRDVVIVGIPLVAIPAGILSNRMDIRELGGKIGGLRSEMNSRFNKVEDHLVRINADLHHFYRLRSKLEGRMDAIEKRG